MRRPVYITTLLAAATGAALIGWLAYRPGSPGPLASAHTALTDDCSACHDDGDHVDNARCAACHTDPATGAELAFVGFARHHAFARLACSDCHTEHHGPADVPAVKAGVTFAAIPCETCHAELAIRPVSLADLPASLRGAQTAFPHARHAGKTLSCTRCHPMTPGRTHKLARPFEENCSACHHGPGQRASCEVCHKQPAEYFAGEFEGRPVRPGSHGGTDDITCVACHQFDDETDTFKPPADTCVDCHPPGYTKDFVKDRDDWRQWRKAVDALPKHHPRAEQLQFVGRYWYHNDIQSAKVRKAHAAAETASD